MVVYEDLVGNGSGIVMWVFTFFFFGWEGIITLYNLDGFFNIISVYEFRRISCYYRHVIDGLRKILNFVWVLDLLSKSATGLTVIIIVYVLYKSNMNCSICRLLLNRLNRNRYFLFEEAETFMDMSCLNIWQVRLSKIY